MIKTEKEAASCVCPIISRPLDGGVSFCVTSQCMAWRWAGDEDIFKAETILPVDETTAFTKLKRAPGSLGFCGLAGRP